ncbi:zinc knuckle CX2CX4HX4C containing protein [Tanacetum coccineum]
MPIALISDRGTHFCNKIMERTMKRYGVNHHFSTSYHPQTSGQVENTNRALKRILEKTVKDNLAIWSRKLDDALWDFSTTYRTPIGTTPYKLIYGKTCHLPYEIEHRAYWAFKNCNPNLIAAGSLEDIPRYAVLESACKLKGATIIDNNPSVKVSPQDLNVDNKLSDMVSPSDHIVQSMDINTKSTSYVGVASASTKEQKVNSNFRPLVADLVFDGVNISILHKVVKKVSTRFEHTLYGYFIGKRMVFPFVEYFARNNWGKHGLKRIMMNNNGFFFFKFDSWVGLEAISEGGPWLIRNSPIILKKWLIDTRLLKDELTQADLVDVVTIGVRLLMGDDFT